MSSDYQQNSLSLPDAVAMGTGVMIGAGILALTGQIAELAGPLFPLAFVAGAVVTAFSAYTYIKMSNAWPSAGGIGMILKKAYGPTTVAAGAALLMALSMVINESLVARTFATYLMRGLGMEPGGWLVPAIGVGLIVFAYLVNASGNRSVGLLSQVMAVLKVGGIALFGIAAPWAGGISFEATGDKETGAAGFVASLALAILAFKGFTTITNSGAEITDPHRNVGRAIVISIAICVVVYLLVAFAVGHSVTMLAGVWWGSGINSYIIDAIIGLSVVYKALDNLGAYQKWFDFQPNTKAATLIFGLFHGTGLASKIIEYDISEDGLLWNLLAFNVGVELGQILALFAILVVMGYWRRSERFMSQVVVANVIMVGLGIWLTACQINGFLTAA
ncbi:MAG: amino acid permease [Alphaproteobacteria bacterium]|jgi:amino acid transporter|nr:amino acid permease [Alphaproteobacteria bacterium]